MGQSTSRPFEGVHRTNAQELTPHEAIAVDARQDELMAVESVEGRPPSHWLRRVEWRWMTIGLPVLVLGAVIWALIRGVSAGTVVGFGIAVALLMLVGGWPVWTAGLLRMEEETTARDEAIAELTPSDKR